ncbi:hypothetical protein K2173_022675 [Erythroxylum novogranatense]|uniref:DUF4378 domain-containing protein n=1 Tax=Erythroxylum novogranatense TaxID=1862640 RepID=A0AAV8TNP9_9ROSI|nr:hypothetical protein K2173_022675 [Erythroxylum novogranatense]
MEKRSARSPMPKSPIPNPKSPVAYEKYKSRCAYGLINFFHFRRSNSKKLISNAIHLGRHVADDGYARNSKSEDGVDCITVAIDSGNRKAKILLQESSEHYRKHRNTADNVEQVSSDTQILYDKPRNQRKANKTRHRPRRLPIYGCNDVSTMGHGGLVHQNMAGTSSKKDYGVPAEAPCNQVHPTNGKYCKRDENINEINVQVQMNEEAEAFINKKLIDGEYLSADKASCQSKHFLDSLEVLNANRELFVKLLQDPNSLLVKHIKDMRDSQARKQQTESSAKAKLRESQTGSAEKPEHPVCTKKVQSVDTYLSGGIDDSQLLDQIVLLKPGPSNFSNHTDGIGHESPGPHLSLRNVQQSVGPAFFSFERMKRKLMRAIGVSRTEQHLMTNKVSLQGCTFDFVGTDSCKERIGIQAIERNSAGEENSAFGGKASSSEELKREEKMNEVKDFGTSVSKKSASGVENRHGKLNSAIVKHNKHNKHDLIFEDRVQLSESLNNRNTNLLRKRRPKTWDGISYLPDHDFLSFLSVSPKNKRELGFITPQMRFSPLTNYQNESEKKWKDQNDGNNIFSPLMQNSEFPLLVKRNRHLDHCQTFEEMQNTEEKFQPDIKMQESIPFSNNNFIHRGSMKTLITQQNEHSEVTPSEMPFEQDTSCTCSAYESSDGDNTYQENGLNFFGLDSHVENQKSANVTGDYSSSPSNIQKVEDLGSFKHCIEQPSPVSVLEQSFLEDVPSPLNIERQTVQSSVLQTGIEEDCSATDGSVVNYISTLLDASGFDWDELPLKCHSSNQLLEQSLVQEVGLVPYEICNDHNLLFDYVNEVLLEVCRCHLSYSPWASSVKQRVRPFKWAENMIHEVVKNIDWNLLVQPSLQTLQKAIEMDLKKSGRWMDIRADTEDVTSDIAEKILEDLIAKVSIE